MTELNWPLILGLGATGIPMALLSCLVGLRQKVEVPLWWALYAGWVVWVLQCAADAAFLTILISSLIAGLSHAITTGFLLDRYVINNPWYADQMKGSRAKQRRDFLIFGFAVGIGFGALVGGIAWALQRWVLA